MPVPFRHYALCVLISGLFLGGCASVPVASTSGTAASEPAEAAGDAEPVRDESFAPESLSRLPLTNDLLLRFLVADISLQRGRTALSAQTWYDLANRTHDPRVARRATEVAVGAGQLGLAQETAQQWITAAPNSVGARQILLTLLIRADRVEEARPHIEALLAAKPEEAPAFFMQMHLLWDKTSDRKAAWLLTDELTQKYPQLPEAHFARAVAMANQERFNDAIAELDRALASRPNWDAVIQYKAQLLSNQSPASSVAFLQKSVKDNPMSLVLRNSLARELVAAQRLAEANQVYQEVLNLQATNLDALIGTGLIALQQRDLDTAYRNLSAAITQNPRNVDNLRYYLGQISEERYRFDEALSWYSQVGGEFAPSAKKRLPRVYARLGRMEEARKAIAALPADTEQARIEHIQMDAQLWREAKDFKKGVDTLSKGIATYPQSADLIYDRALLADMQGDYALAESDLRKYVALLPANAQGMNALGYTLLTRTSKLAEAEKLLEQAIALEPDSPVILDSLGWLRYKQGKKQEAKDLLQRAYAKLTEPDVAAHLAEVLWQLGDKAEAKKIVDEALLVDAKNETLLEVISRLGIR
ncbi:tetratricopeptide repeat protein [Iodobacter fluviatilis]|uniref:Flp pilus assembly protein TadD n=1 Tax=Iodobacter fluviatilis TaxID=537 RepID=A0A377SW82_9NEIS|nr:tetratricopeptide repeat protein [Iodobacter fluviatilis]TCU81651.1 Flp pilus assembly protein TadD [Iodobacter fluviatilis]STR44749.1 tetratricopeptide repeat protein [Iodobacter fluviatilis]